MTSEQGENQRVKINRQNTTRETQVFREYTSSFEVFFTRTTTARATRRGVRTSNQMATGRVEESAIDHTHMGLTKIHKHTYT